MNSRKAVYYLCTNPGYPDPVAQPVFKAILETYDLDETDIIVDGHRVIRYTDEAGDAFYFVQTDKVICHDYPYYLPIMNKYFKDFDAAGLVTWHGGQNAPDKILTVHTTGDVESANFGPANSRYMRNLLLALDKFKTVANLEEFSVTTEATHWSGIVNNGGSPDLIPQYPVPLMDVEIGSTEGSWSNYTAAKVLAKALSYVFKDDDKTLKNLLCAGGIHFDPNFAAAVFKEWGDNTLAFGISHILANQWLVTGDYGTEEGQARLEACLNSMGESIDGIVFHDNLQGPYKEQLRILGRKLNVPVFKHQVLRNPEKIEWTR
jgi:D-tyrosyl-tRNA(Tyr) deacylase